MTHPRRIIPAATYKDAAIPGQIFLPILIGAFALVSLWNTGNAQVPVLVLDFNEQTGDTARDLSGNGFHGELASGAEWNSMGHFDGGVKFNGKNGWVRIVYDSLLNPSQYTIMAWVYSTGNGNDKERREILENPGSYWMNIRQKVNTLRVGGFFGKNSEWVYVDSKEAIPNNKWTHTASTCDGTRLRSYINGVLAADTAIPGELGVKFARDLFVGLKKDEIAKYNGAWFEGTIDDVRVYSGAMTQAQIQAAMKTPFQLTSALKYPANRLKEGNRMGIFPPNSNGLFDAMGRTSGPGIGRQAYQQEYGVFYRLPEQPVQPKNSSANVLDGF